MTMTRGSMILAASAGLAMSATAHAQFVLAPGAGTFTDISATGTLVATGDDVSGAVTVSAAVANAAFPAGVLGACTNGHVGYGTDTQFGNLAVPNAGFYAGATAAAVFWDDLITNAGPNAGVYQLETTEGGVPVLIIQWNNMDHYVTSPSTALFQLKIFGGAGGPGGARASFIFQDVDFGDANNNGASATVGYQVSGTVGFQFSNNAPSITNGMVLSLVPDTVTGACCLATGSCTPGLTAGACATAGGVWQGAGSACGTCPQPGACCVTSGCVVATAANCTAQNGTYRGDGTACATANCPQPCPPITGTLVTGPATWPVTHATIPGARLFRDGIPDTCAAPGSAATSGAGPYNCDVYSFTNTSASSVCVTFTMTATGDCNLYGGAYIGGFDVNNVVGNNVASTGNSTGIPPAPVSMSFTVPGNTAFQIVINDSNAVGVSTCATSYEFQLSGGALSCSPQPPSCYANCDASTNPPTLNVLDFNCFLNRFAAGCS